jgi:hypothetical protein
MVVVVKARTRHESVEVADYQNGLTFLSTTGLALYDVLWFLLSPVHNVLINLIGLHYCLFHLNAQVNTIPILYPLFPISFPVVLTIFSPGGRVEGAEGVYGEEQSRGPEGVFAVVEHRRVGQRVSAPRRDACAHGLHGNPSGARERRLVPSAGQRHSARSAACADLGGFRIQRLGAT